MPNTSRRDKPSPYGVSVELEPISGGRTRPALTLLLTATHCSIGCHFCDLWTHNHPEPTPPGSIPKQIESAIKPWIQKRIRGHETWAIKLYNGGNFTDPRSIPDSDWSAIANLCRPFSQVVIENHATMCGDRLLRFQSLLDNQLEVAIGLETTNEAVLKAQAKKMTLPDFDRAARFLAEHRIDLRCFIMLQLPGSDPTLSVSEAVASVAYAIDRGAKTVSIIPTRPHVTAHSGSTTPSDAVPSEMGPSLWQLEWTLHDALQSLRDRDDPPDRRPVVLADTWDLQAVRHCRDCQRGRIENLLRMNTQQRPLQFSCDVCTTCRHEILL